MTPWLAGLPDGQLNQGNVGRQLDPVILNMTVFLKAKIDDQEASDVKPRYTGDDREKRDGSVRIVEIAEAELGTEATLSSWSERTPWIERP